MRATAALLMAMSLMLACAATAQTRTRITPPKWSWIAYERVIYTSSRAGSLELRFATSGVLDHPGPNADATGRTDKIETRLRLLITAHTTHPFRVAGTQFCGDDNSTSATHTYRFAVKSGRSYLLPKSSVADPPFNGVTAPTVTCAWTFTIDTPSLRQGQPVTVETLAFAPGYVLGVDGAIYDGSTCRITIGGGTQRRTCQPLTPKASP